MPPRGNKLFQDVTTTGHSYDKALEDGRLRLSTYLGLYAHDEFEPLNITLIRNEAEKLEAHRDQLLRSVDLLIANRAFADHGEQ